MLYDRCQVDFLHAPFLVWAGLMEKFSIWEMINYFFHIRGFTQNYHFFEVAPNDNNDDIPGGLSSLAVTKLSSQEMSAYANAGAVAGTNIL